MLSRYNDPGFDRLRRRLHAISSANTRILLRKPPERLTVGRNDAEHPRNVGVDAVAARSLVTGSVSIDREEEEEAMMKQPRVLAASKEASRERRLINAVPVVLAVSTLAAASAAAQEKCKMSWESEASDAKYTQQLALDVGDIPGHQVRVYELYRVYPNAKPNCEGLKWTEQWSRSFSDLVERSGRTWGYTVTMLENGDKIFGEFNGTVQTKPRPI